MTDKEVLETITKLAISPKMNIVIVAGKHLIEQLPLEVRNRVTSLVLDPAPGKTTEQITARIKVIEADERYQSGLNHPAEVTINAPLALVQLSFETEIRTLRWVLQEAR